MSIEGWEKRKIGDFFSHTTPGDWGKEADASDGVPVLRSTNFTNSGAIDYSDIVFRQINKQRLTTKQVNSGTILIEKSGGGPSQPAGRVVYCDREFGGTASNFIEIANVTSDLSSKYIFYLLYYLYQIGLVLKYQQQTTGIINFKLNEYKKEEVFLPESRAEQTQIAAILSTVDRAIAQTEAIIAKQQRLKTGLMQDLLTRGIDAEGNIRTEATHQFKDSPLGRIPVEWGVEEIKSRASVRGGKRLPMGHSYSESDTGLRYLQTTDFIGKKLNYSGMHFLSPKTFQTLERYEIVDGNTFISIAGVNLGVAGVFRPNISDRTILTENAAKIDLSGDDIPEYAATQINGPLVQMQIASDKGIGAGVPKLALFRIESLLIPWPQPAEQKEILKKLKALEVSLEKEQTLLAKYLQTKTGLMQDLLTGQVRVV